MYMTTVFCVFAVLAGIGGLLMPHLVFRLGFLMMAIYLGLAIVTALLTLTRRTR